MRFQEGDIVKIAKTFTDLDGEKEYPQNTEGKVYSINHTSEHPIKVSFDGVEYGASISEFMENELRLVRRS